MEKRGSRQPLLKVHLLKDEAVMFPLEMELKVRPGVFRIHVPV